MPAFVGSVVAWLGSTVLASTTLGTFLVANAAAVASGALLLGGLALSASQAAKAKRQARDAYNAAQVDRLANVVTTVAPRELVLGRVRKGGAVFFHGSTGVNKSTYIMCIALAGHEIDAVEQVYLNDQPVTLDGSGNVTTGPYAVAYRANGTATANSSGVATLEYAPIAGTATAWTGTNAGPEGDLEQQLVVISGLTATTAPNARVNYQYEAYTYTANIRAVLGTDDQAADARLQALFPGQWTADHRARGVAYLVCEFTYNETAYPSGLPTVTAVLRGAKLYDPRENLLKRSQEFGHADWTSLGAVAVTSNDAVAPDGTTTADLISDASAAEYRGLRQTITVANDSSSWCASIYVKKTTGGTAATFGINLNLTGGSSVFQSLRLNTDTGAAVTTGNPVTVTSHGDYWRASCYLANNGTGNTSFLVSLFPATSAYGGGTTDTVAGQGAHHVWGAQLNAGTTPLPYTATAGTSRATTTAWSENPALMMRHVYAHPQFGRGAPTAGENARIIAAANACDTSHGYVVNGVTDTQALYRAALVVPYGAAAKDVLDDLAQSMAGSWAFAGGELYLKPGVWSASVMSLGEPDLAVVVRTGAAEEQQPIAISVHRERAQKFNAVTPTIWDSAQEYKQVTITPVKGAALITRDGAEIVQAVTMPAVPYAPQAQHIAGVLMRDARDPLTVTLPFKLKAYPLELLDTIDLTISRYGWSGKTFQVLGREWSADGGIMLTLKETAEAIYTPDAEFLAQGYASNTNLANAWYVPDLGELTVSSGTDELLKLSDGSILTRMRVSWVGVTDAAVLDSGSIEVQYRPVLSDGAWSRAEIAGAETQLLLSDVQDGNWYTVRARARTRTAVGIWSVVATHLVVGKTEAPPPFDRFLVLAQPDGTRQLNFGYTTTPVPVDWLGAQIRYLAGSHGSPDWDSMTVLSDSATHYTASPVEANTPSAGEYTFACRSMDTSGNLSTYLLHTITLPDRRLGSVFDEFDESAWAGTLTGCSVNAEGYLEAIDTTTWATLPATWADWTRWNYAPTSPITYETPAQDLGAPITGQIGSTVDADGTTLVEMATSDDGSTWSSWGSTSAPFVAQYVKLRLTVTATGPAPVPLVRSFEWLVDAPLQTEYLNDIDISALTGSYRIGTGDVRAPMTLSLTLVKRVQVTIQDSTAGVWTWALIDKTLTYGPRVQFRLGGVLTDPALVDFYIEGF